jgi:hypothetical protein
VSARARVCERERERAKPWQALDGGFSFLFAVREVPLNLLSHSSTVHLMTSLIDFVTCLTESSHMFLYVPHLFLHIFNKAILLKISGNTAKFLYYCRQPCNHSNCFGNILLTCFSNDSFAKKILHVTKNHLAFLWTCKLSNCCFAFSCNVFIKT